MANKSMIETSAEKIQNLDLTINDFRSLAIRTLVNDHKFRKERKMKCKNHQICRGYGNLIKRHKSHYSVKNCPFKRFDHGAIGKKQSNYF
jgi:hypothetical protein